MILPTYTPHLLLGYADDQFTTETGGKNISEGTHQEVLEVCTEMLSAPHSAYHDVRVRGLLSLRDSVGSRRFSSAHGIRNMTQLPMASVLTSYYRGKLMQSTTIQKVRN